jgi:hypothetical protein
MGEAVTHSQRLFIMLRHFTTGYNFEDLPSLLAFGWGERGPCPGHRKGGHRPAKR